MANSLIISIICALILSTTASIVPKKMEEIHMEEVEMEKGRKVDIEREISKVERLLEDREVTIASYDEDEVMKTKILVLNMEINSFDLVDEEEIIKLNDEIAGLITGYNILDTNWSLNIYEEEGDLGNLIYTINGDEVEINENLLEIEDKNKD